MRVALSFLFSIFMFNLNSQGLSQDLLVDFNFNNSVNDTSGNNYNAINNGAVYVADRFGNENSALYFDGIDDFIELPNIAELKPNLPVSFSFWIKYDSYSIFDRELFNTSFEEDRNTGVFFNAQSSTGNFAVNYGDGGNSYISSTRRSYVTNAQIQIDTWYHIAVIVSSATSMKIYVDCVENGGTYSGSGGDLVYSDFSANIGRHDRDLSSSANYFKGTIDDFKYWSREITAEEISRLCSPLSIDDYQVTEKSFLRFYPNPSSDGVFNIETNIDDFDSIKVFDTTGKLVFHEKFQPMIDLSQLSNGIYIINTIGNGISESRKVVIDYK